MHFKSQFLKNIYLQIIKHMRTIKIKKVLIALDYDPSAQIVAETGFSLAKALKAKVVLMHVISDIKYYSTMEFNPIMGFIGYSDLGMMQEQTDGLKKASQRFLDKIKQHLGDKTIETIVIDGEYAHSIINTAKQMNADLIILGSHSKRWLEHIVMGSVTEKVQQLSTVPLFIVPTNETKE